MPWWSRKRNRYMAGYSPPGPARRTTRPRREGPRSAGRSTGVALRNHELTQRWPWFFVGTGEQGPRPPVEPRDLAQHRQIAAIERIATAGEEAGQTLSSRVFESA